MRKTLLSLVAIMLVSFSTSFAQTEILNENFETVIPDEDIALTGWVNVAEVGTRAWIGKEYDANKYAQFSSYNSGEANTGWLVTPALDLTNSTAADFMFDINVGYWTHAGLVVLVSTDFDGTNVAGATWDDVSSSFTIPTEPTSGYGTFAAAGTMDLASYLGETIYIAFKYTGDDNASQTTTYQVDNVVVTSTIGVNEVAKENVAVYPNPAQNQITINAKIENIKISNTTGQVVYTGQENTIDVSNLSNGMYFIAVEEIDGTVKTGKFLKK